jgi:site-specific recombinase XerD
MGASMEFVSEALGHNNLKTTQNYFAGFPEKDKKVFMEKMMKF